MNKPLQQFALLSFLLVAVAAFAQSETPAAPQYAEEIEVRVIDVDVVVTDRQGNPLTNLTRENFELYEDGKRVDITYFSRVVDGRIADLPAPAPGTTPGGTVVPQPGVQQPRIPLTWIVFIDHTNLPLQNRNVAMRQLQTFMQRALSRGDRGVIALNDGRSFKLRQGLTDDPKLIVDTLAKMEKERMSVSPTKNRTATLMTLMRRSEEDMGAGVRPGGGITANHDDFNAQVTGTEIEHLIEEEAARTKFAVQALGSMLDALAQVEGRLALVYVGAGFNSLPASDLAATWKSRYKQFESAAFNPQPEKVREPIEREITRLFNSLSAHRVTVYTIHGGEQSGSVTDVSDSGQWGAVDTASNDDTNQLTEAARGREMAQRTGGLFFKVNQNLATQMEAVVRDLDNFYSLGYKPTGSAGASRRVRVKVDVEGARVRHRESVRERTRAEKAAGAVVASMVQPPQPKAAARVANQVASIPAAVTTAANPLGVSVQAERPVPDGWTRDFKLAFDFSIQLDALTFVKRNELHRADFVMHFSLVGKDGSVYPLESREQSLTVPAADLKKDNANALTSYAWHVDLAPLKIPETVPAKQEGLRLSVTVEDRNSGVRSVVTVPLGAQKQTRG